MIIMQKKPNFTNLLLEKRKAHSDQIISISLNPADPQILATSSEDQTIRIWDLRLNSSIKIIKSEELKEQLCNCSYTRNEQVFVGCGKNIYAFDIRKEDVFIKSSKNKSDSHIDEINQICFSNNFELLAGCDDQGDTRIYDPKTLKTTHVLDQQHKNISFSIDFIYPENYKLPVCVSTSFDTHILYWNLDTQTPIKDINLTELLKQYVTTHCPPLIYSVQGMKSSVLVSTETGHVVCLAMNEKKPRFILQASLSKVVKTSFAKFNQNILLTVSAEGSFSMYDFAKRNEYNNPVFIQKFKTFAQPHWIESTDNKILVADKSEYLSVFHIK